MKTVKIFSCFMIEGKPEASSKSSREKNHNKIILNKN